MQAADSKLKQEIEKAQERNTMYNMDYNEMKRDRNNEPSKGEEIV